MQDLCNKCGYLGRKFSYYQSDKIEGFGGEYSFTDPILTGPVREFTQTEEFLLAKKIHKIRLQDITHILTPTFNLIGLMFAGLSLYKSSYILGPGTFAAIYLFSEFYSAHQKSALEFQTDLEAAKSLGFEQALKSLENIQQDPQFNFYSSNITERIRYLQKQQWLEGQKA